MRDCRSDTPAKFTAAYRLSRNKGFNHALRAESISDGNFKISFVRNGKKNARLGIIAGKKALSRAVDRNRMKRIVREAFRQHHIKLHGYDLVVMVKRGVPIESSKQSGNLKMLFSRIENRCTNL